MTNGDWARYDSKNGQKSNHIPYYYEMLTFICDINLVFQRIIRNFAAQIINTYLQNGKQDLQAYDGDVGAPIR